MYDSPDSKQKFRMVARARQFSSFILVLGRIASADLFEPIQAMVVQNKDVLKIPLIMEILPAAKAFKAAICT